MTHKTANCLDPQIMSLVEGLFDDGFERSLCSAAARAAEADAVGLLAFSAFSKRSIAIGSAGLGKAFFAAHDAFLTQEPAVLTSLVRCLDRQPLAVSEEIEERASTKDAARYTQWLGGHGYPHSLIAQINREDTRCQILLALRSEASGPFPVRGVKALGANLAPYGKLLRIRQRAVSLNRYNKVAEAATNWLSLGIIVVDRFARPKTLNASGEELLRRGDFLTLSRGIIATTRKQQTDELHEAIRKGLPAVVVDTAGRDGEEAYDENGDPLPRAARPLQILVRPLSDGAQADGGELGGHVGLFILPQTRASAPPGHLAKLYGLTPAEERLALEILSGKALADAADALNIKGHTARSYLKRVFAKTGVKRQAELVSRLMADAPPLRPSSETASPALAPRAPAGRTIRDQTA